MSECCELLIFYSGHDYLHRLSVQKYKVKAIIHMLYVEGDKHHSQLKMWDVPNCENTYVK